jgi:predicted dehydrogenase
MSSSTKIGFAVIGLGAIAQSSVLPSLAKHKRARLVALVSRDKKKAQRLARKHKAKFAYTNEELSSCLANPEVDALFIATPPGEHASATIAAARAHKHVLCEKPLAASAEQSAAMVEVCRENGVILMTAYRKYFEPSSSFLKKLIQQGDLGRIDLIHTSFSEMYRPGISQPWLVEPELAGGGPLMDLGIYCVNTNRWLMDEDPVEVSAQSWVNDAARFKRVEEGITFRLRFPSGAVLQGSSSYNTAPASFIFVSGSKGWASLSPAYSFEFERRVVATIGERHIDKKFKIIDEFAPEFEAFISTIQTGRPLAPDGAQGHRDMIILKAIYQAAREKQPVAIRY